MDVGQQEAQLIADAIGGNLLATQCLLVECRPRLLAYLRRHLPAESQRLIEAEDVLQDTFTEAFRRIGTFQPQGDDSLYRWLVTMARNRVINLIRAQRRGKRAGGRRLEEAGADGNNESVVTLLEQLASMRRSPSRSAAAHEAMAAVEQSLEKLPEPYREAIRLRYLSGLSAKEAAGKMNRTEHAFHMLCNRGMRALREELRSVSLYL